MKSLVLMVFLSATLGAAQSAEKYKVRLGVIPISNAGGRNNIDESPSVFAAASAVATLTGTKLAITGSFEGFKSAATVARVHQGVIMGSRGPALFDLTVTQATKGSISGNFDLSPAQANLLKQGRLYVQIHSQTMPDGALWGWLVK